jgi:hypothetical protein
MRLRSLDDGDFGRSGIADIAGDGNAADLGRDAFGELLVEVAHRHPGAERGQFSRGGSSQSRCAPGDDRGPILHLHDFLLISC